LERFVSIDAQPKALLRTASIVCLVVWAAIWLLFLGLRLSPLDIRRIPGIGLVMLGAFAVVMVVPMLAAGFAGAAVVRQPQNRLNWVTLGCAIAALLGQVLLFLISRWL
jgi:hypothetical protein